MKNEHVTIAVKEDNFEITVSAPCTFIISFDELVRALENKYRLQIAQVSHKSRGK